MAEQSGLNHTGHDLLTRLDDDYIYLLQFIDQPLVKLTKDQQELVRKWLVKLGTSPEAGSLVEKRKRNSYLLKLISSMQENMFAPFNAPPPSGELPWEDFDSSWLAEPSENPEWLNRLMLREASRVHVGGRDFETYLATKLFENGRGACAYLAVSAQNEGDNSAWMRIRSNQKRCDQIHQMFEKEFNEDVSE